MNPPRPLLGIGLVLAAASLWGTTGTAQALAGGQLSAYWFGALRLLVAAAFFAACAAATGAFRRPAGRAGPRLASSDVVGAGLCMAVYNLSFFAGILSTGVALGTAIALGSGPLWAGLLQALAARQPPTGPWWAGTGAAVAGGVLMTLGAGVELDGSSAAGVALCLLSGFSYAAYSLLGKRMAPAAPATTITLYAFGIAAALALATAWFVAGPPRVGAADAAAVGYTGIVTAGIAYLMFARALLHIGPATGVTLALGEPVVAFALAVAVLGESPSGVAYAGLALVVGGVLVVVRQALQGRDVVCSSAPGATAAVARPTPPAQCRP